MQRIHRFVILLTGLIFSGSASALQLFLDALEWRVTNSNNWVYINSETLPQQFIDYHTIDFHYSPGFRMGARYENCNFDALFAYTHYYTSTSESASGNLQPSFSGSVTAKPSHAYLYQAGQVHQAIHYDIFDLNIGRTFYPLASLRLDPAMGLMGGSINQTITAAYQGSTSADEKITNNFSGVGPKALIDVGLLLIDKREFKSELIASFAASYLVAHWNIHDSAHSTTAPPNTNIVINGASSTKGAMTLQAALGVEVSYKQFTGKLAYEINDWFNQNQFFDNDTGAHNNDMVLQGLVLGLAVSI